ncbi:iron-sulfur cluster assembly protein 1-like protein [Tanacetum coccineum]
MLKQATRSIIGFRVSPAPALNRFYHERVVDHYNNPRNVGAFDKNDPTVGTGLVGAPACGDVMKLQIKVDQETGQITDACFKTFGCGSAIASSSVATEWVKGKQMEEVLTIKNTLGTCERLPQSFAGGDQIWFACGCLLNHGGRKGNNVGCRVGGSLGDGDDICGMSFGFFWDSLSVGIIDSLEDLERLLEGFSFDLFKVYCLYARLKQNILQLKWQKLQFCLHFSDSLKFREEDASLAFLNKGRITLSPLFYATATALFTLAPPTDGNIHHHGNHHKNKRL